MYYKGRLQDLLSRKEVIEVLSGPVTKSPQPMMKLSPEPNANNDPRRRFSSRFEDRKREKRPNTGNFGATLPITNSNPDEAITEHLQESSTASNLVRESIRKQEGDKLQERLQARKRASSLKPQKSSQLSSPRETKLEQYQKEIEEIMEKYAEDKIRKVQAIKTKFYNKVGQETEEKKEIDLAQEQIFKERTEKLAIIRTKYAGK